MDPDGGWDGGPAGIDPEHDLYGGFGDKTNLQGTTVTATRLNPFFLFDGRPSSAYLFPGYVSVGNVGYDLNKVMAASIEIVRSELANVGAGVNMPDDEFIYNWRTQKYIRIGSAGGNSVDFIHVRGANSEVFTAFNDSPPNSLGFPFGMDYALRNPYANEYADEGVRIRPGNWAKKFRPAQGVANTSDDPITGFIGESGKIGGAALVMMGMALERYIAKKSIGAAAQGVMNTSEIHFMQSSIKNITGEFTVLGNAEALANGSLSPNVLRMDVWKDASGKVWTLDHRRLAAFRLSGLQEAPIQWANPSGQMWKMTTTNGGTSIKLKLGGGNSMIIK